MARASADGHTARPTLLSRFGAAVVGPRSIRRLTITHAVDDFADSLITLSLIGSLFFSVSLEASRSRILLYLLLTAAPLAVVAQVVGPALDRIRAGSRVVLICSHIARAVFALLLASSLLSLAFYPLVFGILLSRKAYALGEDGDGCPAGAGTRPSWWPPAATWHGPERSPAESAPQSAEG